jgi:fructose-bisphosphate aldolase class 1
MNVQKLINTAQALVADDKGLLAMDESTPTSNKRFAALGIPQTLEARRAYREMIVTTPGLGESISGAILYDETIRQQREDGSPFVKALTDAGIIPGIKVDAGAKDMAGFPGEKILREGRAFRQVASGVRRGRQHPEPGLHRGERAGLGPLRLVVPGSRAGSRR